MASGVEGNEPQNRAASEAAGRNDPLGASERAPKGQVGPSQEQPKMRALVFLMGAGLKVAAGEISLTLFKGEDCAVPLLRLRRQDGIEYLIPFTSIKYIEPGGFEPVEGFEE